MENTIGTAFRLRNDIPAKAGVFSKDIFEYAHKGAKIMIKHGWLEEPPQMEERDQLLNLNKRNEPSIAGSFFYFRRHLCIVRKILSCNRLNFFYYPFYYETD